jgi:hypothetical protein
MLGLTGGLGEKSIAWKLRCPEIIDTVLS